MAMIYTLVTSAKDWLLERFAQDDDTENAVEDEVEKDEVWFSDLKYDFYFLLPLLFHFEQLEVTRIQLYWIRMAYLAPPMSK